MSHCKCLVEKEATFGNNLIHFIVPNICGLENCELNWENNIKDYITNEDMNETWFKFLIKTIHIPVNIRVLLSV